MTSEQTDGKVKENPYRYNAERVDYVPGIADFQYLRARYYRPDLARFISQDIVWGTITTPLSQNLFIYVQNNPVNMTDPSGLYPKEAEEYYKNKISEAVKNYTALEGYQEKVFSQMDKMYMQSQMRMYEKQIASYEQTLTKMTGNYVSDSIAKAKGESVRDTCNFDNVIYSDYGRTVKQNDYGALTDIDLIARLIFHEDGHLEGQNAIAWTIHNRFINPDGSGEYDNFTKLIQEGYTDFMGKDKDGLNKFWATNEWLNKNTKWYFGAANGSDTKTSWENAVNLAYALVSSDKDTAQFEKYVANPFVGVFNPDISASEIKYYINRSWDGDENQVQIGSNHFSNLPH